MIRVMLIPVTESVIKIKGRLPSDAKRGVGVDKADEMALQH